MAGSPTVARKRSEKFSGNITKRGVKREKEEEEKMPLNQTVLVVMLFIVIGSFFVQVMNSFSQGNGLPQQADE